MLENWRRSYRYPSERIPHHPVSMEMLSNSNGFRAHWCRVSCLRDVRETASGSNLRRGYLLELRLAGSQLCMILQMIKLNLAKKRCAFAA